MKNLVILALLALGATACAPKLIIRHDDPSVEFVQIRVDGDSEGFLDYGDAMKMRVRRGYHRVEAVPRGESFNPWAEDGEGWTFYVDRKAELTLMPIDR